MNAAIETLEAAAKSGRRAPAGPAHAAESAALRSAVVRIRVPVIARLAVRTMPIRMIRAFSPSSIIEFDRSVETPVDVLINNHVIARAQVVKVGEYFGLRILQVVDATRRMQSCRG